MICASRRKTRNSLASSASRSRPSKRIRPASGSISRSTSRLTVDLPQPDSPTSASVLPASTLKLTPSTAFTKAVGRPNTERPATKCFTRFSTSSRAVMRPILRLVDRRVSHLQNLRQRLFSPPHAERSGAAGRGRGGLLFGGSPPPPRSCESLPVARGRRPHPPPPTVPVGGGGND